MEKIGVYVCHCGKNIAGTVDIEEVTEFASKMDGVAAARHYEFMCSDPGQEMIKEDIEKEGLTKIVVAACSPELHGSTFMITAESGGINPYLSHMANIREHCSWVTEEVEKATEKARKLIEAAVCRVKEQEPIEVQEVDVVPKALVVGGGITGIESALGIADSGKEVYLVERTPSIGGHMAQLDKTFPTLDCSSCILTPKMSDIGNHPNVNLMTYSEVESVDGFPGNYKVKIRKKARYVTDDCTGCAVCEDVCPIAVLDEFNEGLDVRKAIYRPFPQSVPNLYTIDMDHCIRCDLCVEKCKDEGPDAVNLEDEDEIVEINVGNITVATGYELMNPGEIERYGYGKYDNVFTALEIERMIDPTGPTSGEVITKEGKPPKSIAIIHCVGSRDENYNEYCSRVCCMYSMKLAHLIRDETGAEVFELYMDMRSFGKGFEEFYNRVKREDDVIFVRGKAGAINVGGEGEGLTISCEDTLIGERTEIPADMVILSPAIVPRSDADDAARLFSLGRSEDGFFMEKHPKLAPVNTMSDGVFIAGACQGPKDIPDSVAQGAGAAEKAISMIDAGVLELEPYISKIDEEICAGCKTCICVCPYDAVKFDEEKNVARVKETLCNGCGSCISACPSGSAQQAGYKDEQILAEVIATAKR